MRVLEVLIAIAILVLILGGCATSVAEQRKVEQERLGEQFGNWALCAPNDERKACKE